MASPRMPASRELVETERLHRGLQMAGLKLFAPILAVRNGRFQGSGQSLEWQNTIYRLSFPM